MAGSTSRAALYLAGGGSTGQYGADETADVDVAINPNLVKIDNFLSRLIGTNAQRTSTFAATYGYSPYEGLRFYETDTKLEYQYIGGNWVGPIFQGIGKSARFYSNVYTTYSNSDVQVPLTSTDYNDDTNWYSISNGDVLLGQGGVYSVVVSCAIENTSGAGYQSLKIMRNGGALLEVGTSQPQNIIHAGTSMIYRFNKNDLIRFDVYGSPTGRVRGSGTATDVFLALAWMGA